jgi:hypothetical protein
MSKTLSARVFLEVNMKELNYQDFRKINKFMRMKIPTEKGAKLQDNIHSILGRECPSLLVIEET